MMPGVGDLETIIGSAANGGWGWFDELPEHIRDKVKVRQAESEEDRRAVARAWADFADSPGGAKALQILFDTTLNRTVFFANLGQEPMAMAVWGAFREGQNALALEIARQIAAGRNEEQPKPRET